MAFWGWIVVMAVTFGIFGGTLGCSGATFRAEADPVTDAGPVPEDADAYAKATHPNDAGDAGEDALTCPEYSCKPGCGECDKDAGMYCGSAGPFICGSFQCAKYVADTDGGYPCLSGPLRVQYGCGGSGPDTMPNCTYQGTSQLTRWYCCQN